MKRLISDAATAAYFAVAWLTEPQTKTDELAERFGYANREGVCRHAKFLGLPPRRRGAKPQRRRAI